MATSPEKKSQFGLYNEHTPFGFYSQSALSVPRPQIYNNLWQIRLGLEVTNRFGLLLLLSYKVNQVVISV